jgi:hypothetical protein
MKINTDDKIMLGFTLFLVFLFSIVVGAYENRVSQYKSIARFYYNRDVMNKAQKGICSDTPQIDDAKIIKTLDITGHRQIDKDIDWVKSEFLNN